MDGTTIDQKYFFRIKVKENLEEDVHDRFNGMDVTPLTSGGTLITGRFIDQPALRGFLTQLWNLNFTVLSVEKVGNGFHREIKFE